MEKQGYVHTHGQVCMCCYNIYMAIIISEYDTNESDTAFNQVDWNAVVLSNPRDATTRSIQEAISIRTTNNTLNRDSGALPSEYDHLVHTYFNF